MMVGVRVAADVEAGRTTAGIGPVRNTLDSVAVLGAGGFVGRHLRSRLDKEPGPALHLVDCGPPPRSANVPTERAHWHEASDLSDIPVDVVDAAIILASQTNVDEALERPAEAFEQNISIARQVAEWARRTRPRRLVYVSTDEVLGPSERPLTETAPLRPSQPYAASKAAAEVLLACYRDCYGLDIVIVRACNLVGVGQRARKLLPTAVAHLLAGEPAPVMGDGTHRREWMAVSDLVSAVEWALYSPSASGVYHASSGWHASVREVLELVCDTLGVPLRVRPADDRLVHDHCYSMSSARLRKTGWAPRTPPRQALRDAVLDLANAARGGRLPVADYRRP
jgi:dTDP-glucose 4,6-dehydratase